MVQRPQLLPGLPSRRARGPLRSAAVRGDARAFATLYDRHHQDLYRYCRSILRHDEDARDAVQSTFAKAFSALAGEDRDFELRPWLFRIAHNEAIDLIRSRRETHDIEDVPEQGSDSLPEQVEQRAELRELQADLAVLPERQRAALVLRELSGLAHEEIATVLDTTPRAVKQVIFEARAALHECREGRAMPCDPVQRAVSDGDGRVLRGRKVRAHLRGCDGCRAFQAALERRPAQLAMLSPPLPLAAAAALLGQVLSGAQSTGAAGAAAAASGTAAAGSAAGGLAGGLGAKLALVAAVAVTGTGGGAAALELARPAERTAPPVPGKVAGPAAPAGPARTGGTAKATAAIGERSAARQRPASRWRPGDARRGDDRADGRSPADRAKGSDRPAGEGTPRNPSRARTEDRSGGDPSARRPDTRRPAVTTPGADRPAARPQVPAAADPVVPTRPGPTAAAPVAPPRPAIAAPAPATAPAPPERPAPSAPTAPQPSAPSAPTSAPVGRP